jgi:hypothetical protein
MFIYGIVKRVIVIVLFSVFVCMFVCIYVFVDGVCFLKNMVSFVKRNLVGFGDWLGWFSSKICIIKIVILGVIVVRL